MEHYIIYHWPSAKTDPVPKFYATKEAALVEWNAIIDPERISSYLESDLTVYGSAQITDHSSVILGPVIAVSLETVQEFYNES